MFAVAWMALMPLSLMSAHIGVLVWVWVALLSPGELLYGFMAGVPFNKIVAVITLGMILASRERKDPYFDGMSLLLVLLAMAATMSWAGAIVSTPDGTDLYLKMIKEIMLAFAIMAVMMTRHRMHLLALTIALSFGFIAVKEGLIFLLTAGGHKVVGTGSVGDNNSLATALLMIVPLIYYLARYSAVRAIRIGLLAAMALALVTVVATYSRGGFVGLLVLGGFLVKNSRNKLGSLALVAVAGILTYVLAPDSWFDRVNTINDVSTDGSFMGRVVAWKISWLIAMDNPLFGGGFHAVQRFVVWDTYRPLLYVLDFIKTPPADNVPHAAHSTYFELIGDLGFVGFGLFMATMAMAFWNCFRIGRMCRGHPSLTWAGDLARMMQISLIVYAVTTAALSMGYFELYYILVALTSRCRRTVQLAVHGLAAEVRAVRHAPGQRAPNARPGDGSVGDGSLGDGRPVPAFARQPGRAASPADTR